MPNGIHRMADSESNPPPDDDGVRESWRLLRIYLSELKAIGATLGRVAETS